MNRLNRYYNPPFIMKMMAMYVLVGVAFWAKTRIVSLSNTHTAIARLTSGKPKQADRSQPVPIVQVSQNRTALAGK